MDIRFSDTDISIKDLRLHNISLERTGDAGGLTNEGVNWARMVTSRR
jgi:hypothetical protein